VNQIVADDELMDEAIALAKKIASLSPLAIRATKEATIKSDYLQFDEICQLMSAKKETIMKSKDAKEGKKAFIFKREPKFIGE